MPAGSISLTNGSSSVTGDGTSFTTEVENGEYLLCTDGGTNYTLPVTSVPSDTELTLSGDFTGPTASGLSYRVISGAQLVSVPTDLINQTTLAIRELNTDKANWNQLLTVDGDVTIIAPDGTKISGPSWVKVSKGINATDLDKAQQIADQTSAAATAAATSETNAKASEDAAAQSSSDASTSATNAADSAQQAADSASSIGDELDQASASAAAAAKSATAAAASETNASTSETNAKSSEDAAAASQQAAAESQSAAATSETNAATSEGNAADSATSAGTSESNAAQSASDASDSASAAATSETNAASSASDSAESATNARKSADRAEDAASALENNNALAEAIDHINTDTNDVFFKGSIASGGSSAFTELRTVSDGTTPATSEIVLTDSTLVTDDNPDAEVVKIWTLPDDEGQLITLDDAGIASASDSSVAFKGSVSVGVDASRDAELVTLRQLNSAVAGGGGSNGATLNGVMNNFIGAVMWMNGTRASLPAGYLAADGQMLNRSDYPDLWNAVASGLFVSTEEANWTGTTGPRAYYSDGDGSTTFRLPDLNGRQSGSIQGVFLRGDEDGMLPGEIRSSALPNITAQFGSTFDGQVWLSWNSAQGSASPVVTVNNVMHPLSGYSAVTGLSQMNIDASRSSGVYQNGINEVRPPSASGMWIIRVSGTFNAADTNFNVINGDASAPDSGTVTFGGDLRSVYQLNGTDFATLAFRPRVTWGTGVTGEIRLIDASTSTVATKTWTMPGEEGQLVAVDSAGTTVAPIVRATQQFQLNNDNNFFGLSFNGGTVQASFLNISNVDFNGLWVHTSTMSVNGSINNNVAAQGMHFLWNETGGQGEGDIVINRGGGVGGLHVRVVNQDNTIQETAFTFSYDGILDCPNGNQSVGGRIRAFTDVGANQVMLIVDGATKIISLSDSDERLKENIIDADEELAISIIERVHPVCFNFKDYKATKKIQDEAGKFIDSEIIVKGKYHRFGVIAQELEMLLPEAVNTTPDDDAYKSIDLMEMNGLLLTTAHAQQKIIKDMSSQLEDEKQKIKSLIDALGYLEDGDQDSFKNQLTGLRGGHI